jgi:hypothetical protein
MQFLKLDPAIPFLQKEDSIPDTVRNAALFAPYNKPSYRSERRLSVWLFAAPDMSAGASPKFTPAWRNQHLEDFVLTRLRHRTTRPHSPLGGGWNHAAPRYHLCKTRHGSRCHTVRRRQILHVVQRAETETHFRQRVTYRHPQGDVYTFHNKYIHAGWSHNPRRITLNAWKLRDDWKTAFRMALRT